MARTIKIDGRSYLVREFDFNAACELAEKGYDIFNGDNAPVLVRMRAIAAWVMNVDEETAGNVIQKHIVDGGNLEDISNAFNVALEESGFLRGLRDSVESDTEEKPKTRK